ncbi:hypothetical protein N0V87_010621, partial [Didymella glomerata]
MESSPYVIDSDSEDAHQDRLARKRIKYSGVIQAQARAVQQSPMSTALPIIENESSDDEPLINCVQAKKPGVGSDAVPTGSRSTFGGYG